VYLSLFYIATKYDSNSTPEVFLLSVRKREKGRGEERENLGKSWKGKREWLFVWRERGRERSSGQALHFIL